MYQVLFFNATHQIKVIAIGVSEANPLGRASILANNESYRARNLAIEADKIKCER